MDPIEFHSVIDKDRGHDVFRIEKAQAANEGKFLISVLCPRTSNGAQIYLSATQIKELGKTCEYLTR